MQVKVLRTKTDILLLEGEWNNLLADSPVRSVFLTWEWMSSWMDAQPSSFEYFVLEARDEHGNLQGIAPLYRAQYTFVKFVRIKLLRVVGDSGTGGEYGSLIVRPEAEEQVLSKFSETLIQHKHEWGGLWITNVACWNAAENLWIRLFDKSNLEFRQRDRSFSAVELPDNPEVYLQNLSKGSRQNVKRNHKRVFSNPNAAVSMVESAEELQQTLEVLFALHEARWALKNDPGSFRKNPLMEKFYLTFAPKALEQGWLRLAVLRIDDQPVAVQYGFCFDNNYLQLQEGFDPEAVDGVGTALRKVTIDNMINAGVTTYDFLGGHTEHKRRWGAVERLGCDLIAFNKNLVSRLVFQSKVWPTGRFLSPS